MPGKTFQYELNAEHTDGRRQEGMAGPTGKKVVLQTQDEARTLAGKWLRPGWIIEIVAVDIVSNRRTVVEVLR